MATSHPYISGAGNVTQMIQHLRKNFPGTVTSETVKKLGIAPNNESYVINALQFIGLIDEEGKKTPLGGEILVLGDDTFPTEFKLLIQKAYSDLHELQGENMWTLDKAALVNYFRKADKTSDAIGTRQAAVFRAFASLAGYGAAETNSKKENKTKPKAMKAGNIKAKSHKPSVAMAPEHVDEASSKLKGKGGMALTVRIEINLPAGGTKENYDDIFKSIKANLLNE